MKCQTEKNDVVCFLNSLQVLILSAVCERLTPCRTFWSGVESPKTWCCFFLPLSLSLSHCHQQSFAIQIFASRLTLWDEHCNGQWKWCHCFFFSLSWGRREYRDKKKRGTKASLRKWKHLIRVLFDLTWLVFSFPPDSLKKLSSPPTFLSWNEAWS